ncbi:MAG: hypothetical protein JO040_13975 [Gemmatimonadetes bacterium]|nr:hypothetical protein [Gemmatimonadota bacterium]
MALISCPDCGTEVSSLAAACPRCARPIAALADVAPAPPALGRVGIPARHAPVVTATGSPSWAALPEIGLHPMSEVKLALLCLATLGLYEPYWFYRNWRLRKQVRKSDVSPFWRAFFAPIFAFSLFEDVPSEARNLRVSVGWSAGEMGVAFLVLSAAWRLPDPYWLVTFLSFVPLVLVQRVINKANAKSTNPGPVNESYSVLNIVGIVLGGIILLLSIIGTLIPTE